METRLKAKLKLSKKLDEKTAEKFFTKTFEEANKDLLKRGCPKDKIKEAAEITAFKAKGDELVLEIVSGTRVRAHTALLRIRNLLTQKMGKELKSGVRKIKIEKFQIKGIKTEKKPLEKIKLPFVKKIEYIDKLVNIEIDPKIPIDFVEKGAIDRIIELVPKKILAQHWGGKKEHWELIWKSPEKKPAWTIDPTKEMVKKGWVKRFGRGVWLHTPTSTAILKAFEKIAIEELLKPLGFAELILPKTIPLDVWLKTGHMPGSAPEFYYLYQAKSVDPKEWEHFKDYVNITKTIPEEMLHEKLEGPIGGMCFSQCLPLYWFFKEKRIPERELPMKFFDRSGTSHRWEAGGLHGIERDSEFHRIEVVWFGTKKQALKIKEEILKEYKKIFNKILDLEWRMVWVTPWYMAQAGGEGTEESKEKGTIDFEAWLPFRGSRKQSEWLEFQNLTVAGTKFSDAWNFKTQKNKEVWTGCTGIGLERWMASFLAQKGLDPKNWPKSFKKYLGELPKEIKII